MIQFLRIRKYLLFVSTGFLVVLGALLLSFYQYRKSFDVQLPSVKNPSSLEEIQNFLLNQEGYMGERRVAWGGFDEKPAGWRGDFFGELREGHISVEGKNFKKFLERNIFDVFTCAKGRGIYFLPEHSQLYKGDFYGDMEKALIDWRSNIPTDLEQILFPFGNSIPENVVSSSFSERRDAGNLGLSYWEAKTSDNMEIFVGLVGGNVVIATSKECLFSASDDLFDLVP